MSLTIRRSYAVLTALALGALLSASAQAQSRSAHDLRLGPAAAFALGGEVEVDDTGPGDDDDDLDGTVGLRLALDKDVHQYISVGGIIRSSWWQADDWRAFEDRSWLLDLGFRALGHYDWREFRFYGGLEPAFVLSVVNDEANADGAAAGFGMSVIIPGFEWWFSDKFALISEMGWIAHWMNHDVDNSNFEYELRLDQMRWDIGIAISL